METEQDIIEEKILEHLSANNRYSRPDQLAKHIDAMDLIVNKACLNLFSKKKIARYESNGLTYYGAK